MSYTNGTKRINFPKTNNLPLVLVYEPTHSNTILIAFEILSVERGDRKRTVSAQRHFEHAIECLVKDLWLGTVIYPEHDAGIHRGSNGYSETPQYCDPDLTYKQATAAYDGMVATDFIRVARDGF